MEDITQMRESLKVLKECAELQSRKSQDYQNPKSTIVQSDYYPRGVLSIMDVIHTKYIRAVSLVEATEFGEEPNFEHGSRQWCLIDIDDLPLPKHLSDYQNITPIEKFVVGQPKQKDGNFSEVEKDILIFINQIKKIFPTTTIVRQDERFTSKIAFQAMIDGGLKKKQRKEKGMIDQVSATLILQSYLDYKLNKI